jgi:hypothetical protein
MVILYGEGAVYSAAKIMRPGLRKEGVFVYGVLEIKRKNLYNRVM